MDHTFKIQTFFSGCPYPTCSRYGRAFSRAHDLKRHIARHQARENKSEPQEQIYNCTICNAQFYNELIFERHKSTHQNGVHAVTSTSGPPYICNFCKKSFEHETLLNAHLPVHLKVSSSRVISFIIKYIKKRSNKQLHLI